MGLISRLFERRTASIDSAALRAMGGASAAGVAVTPSSALQSTAVFACVRLLSESVAMLPALLYRRRADGGKERADNHPVYALLHNQPNPEQTSFELIESLMGQLGLFGNAFAEIQWRNGYPVALWPLRADHTWVQRVNGRLVYDTAILDADGSYQSFRLPAYRVLHVRAFGNGYWGYSPIRYHATTIGLELATREYGARFFGNGARPGVVLTHPGLLDDEAVARIRESWINAHEGLTNAHRVAVLEEGVKLDTLGIPPEEAQFLETRKFQVADIARLYRVPPHLIGDLDKATFGNIEQQSIEFVMYTLLPWLRRWESALMRDLLVESERREYLIEFLVEGLLRGDTQSRYAAYAIGRQWGWLSTNDIRRLENMNPIRGGDGYLVPLNMVPADQVRQAETYRVLGDGGDECTCGGDHGFPGETLRQLPDQRDDEDPTEPLRENKVALALSQKSLFLDGAGRAVRRETADLRRAVKKHLEKRSVADFRAFLDEFYSAWPGVVRDVMVPILLAYATQVMRASAAELDVEDPGVTEELQAFVDRYLNSFAVGWAANSRNQIDALIEQAQADGLDVGELLTARFDEWEEGRAEKTALQQIYEAGNALAIASYASLGVTRLRWRASGKSCSYCQRLNNKVVGIKDFFIDAGQALAGGEGEESMIVKRNTRHGPLHRGCDCVVVAER